MEYAPLPPMDLLDSDQTLASPELHALADTIVNMKLKHVVQLTTLVQDYFGLEDDDHDGVDNMESSEDGEGVADGPAQTAFELKLMSFDAKSKIKVIKEIRAMTGLGLKEAKELVEGAPKVVKKDIKKEEAEELKVKLEEIGAVVEIL